MFVQRHLSKEAHVEVVVHSLGLKVRFSVDIAGQPPMAYSLDLARAASGLSNSSASGSSSNEGSLSSKDVKNIFAQIVNETQKALTPQGRKQISEAALARTCKYTDVMYTAPNCLRFIPKNGSKEISELYYDRRTKLVQSLVVFDPHSKVTTKLVFSNWVIGETVSFQ